MFEPESLIAEVHRRRRECVVWFSRHLRRDEVVKEEASRGMAALSAGPKLDLGFKEGQTITINMPVSNSYW